MHCRKSANRGSPLNRRRTQSRGYSPRSFSPVNSNRSTEPRSPAARGRISFAYPLRARLGELRHFFGRGFRISTHLFLGVIRPRHRSAMSNRLTGVLTSDRCVKVHIFSLLLNFCAFTKSDAAEKAELSSSRNWRKSGATILQSRLMCRSQSLSKRGYLVTRSNIRIEAGSSFHNWRNSWKPFSEAGVFSSAALRF